MATETSSLESRINQLYDAKQQPGFRGFTPDEKTDIMQAIQMMDSGQASVITRREKDELGLTDEYQLNEWLKKAVLLMFAIYDNKLIQNGDNKFYDKVPLKFDKWSESSFKEAGIRVLPTSLVRLSAYLAPGVVVMSGATVNVGARVGKGSMVDSGATIGSCAYIGRNTHISMNAGIGGVLEPLQANPVIVGDKCFVGPGVQVVEGVRIEDGATLVGGVSLSQSTPIYDSTTKKYLAKGVIPAGAVVIPGIAAGGAKDEVLPIIAIIKKYSDEVTKRKVSTNADLH